MDLHQQHDALRAKIANECRTGGSELRIVCGWCGGLLRESSDKSALTSHGMCPTCAAAFERSMTRSNAV